MHLKPKFESMAILRHVKEKMHQVASDPIQDHHAFGELFQRGPVKGLRLGEDLWSKAGRHLRFRNRIHATQHGEGSCPAQRPGVVAATLKSLKCLTVTCPARTLNLNPGNIPLVCKPLGSLLPRH
jgi:hypothetical protein